MEPDTATAWPLVRYRERESARLPHSSQFHQIVPLSRPAESATENAAIESPLFSVLSSQSRPRVPAIVILLILVLLKC